LRIIPRNGIPFDGLDQMIPTYGVKPLLYVLQNGDGQICGAAPFIMITSPITGTRIVSLPFSDHSGPICNDGTQEKELLEGIIDRYRERVKYIEIRSPLRRVG
jgi:hypothetical protein